MLSQYNLKISLILAQCKPDWLNYLLDGNDPVLPRRRPIEEKHMLRMHRIGLYRVDNKRDMYRLSSLLAAILLKDRRVADETVVSALGTEKGGEL